MWHHQHCMTFLTSMHSKSAQASQCRLLLDPSYQACTIFTTDHYHHVIIASSLLGIVWSCSCVQAIFLLPLATVLISIRHPSAPSGWHYLLPLALFTTACNLHHSAQAILLLRSRPSSSVLHRSTLSGRHYSHPSYCCKKIWSRHVSSIYSERINVLAGDRAEYTLVDLEYALDDQYAEDEGIHVNSNEKKYMIYINPGLME